MRHYIEIKDNVVLSVGTGMGFQEISEEQYAHILDVMHNVPTAPSGYAYELHADTFEWGLVELPPMSEPDPDPEEALSILLGGEEV